MKPKYKLCLFTFQNTKAIFILSKLNIFKHQTVTIKKLYTKI